MSQELYQKLTSDKSFFIVGPCVMESMDLLHTVAKELVAIKEDLGVEIIFKSSFDKANRTSASAKRGPGLEEGKEWLREIKNTYNLPVTTDVHESYQPKLLQDVVDIMQIPAFLCRQTDLLLAAAETGKIVNIKKAQFLSGEDMLYPCQKVVQAGNKQVMLTERGNMYGYNNLVVDFRNIPDMLQHGFPVIMDCTHSVQRPGGAGGKTGGNREFVPNMALAAKAFGANGYFIESHPNPEEAWSDGPNQLYLKDLRGLIKKLIQ